MSRSKSAKRRERRKKQAAARTASQSASPPPQTASSPAKSKPVPSQQALNAEVDQFIEASSSTPPLTEDQVDMVQNRMQVVDDREEAVYRVVYGNKPEFKGMNVYAAKVGFTQEPTMARTMTKSDAIALLGAVPFVDDQHFQGQIIDPGGVVLTMDSTPQTVAPSQPAVSTDGLPDLDSIIDQLKAGQYLVCVQCGDDEQRAVFNPQPNPETGEVVALLPADAAETAVSQYVQGLANQGKFPTVAVMVTCYSTDAEFGPFPMGVSLTIDANFLRAKKPGDN